jgi:hypothetical protein
MDVDTLKRDSPRLGALGNQGLWIRKTSFAAQRLPIRDVSNAAPPNRFERSHESVHARPMHEERADRLCRVARCQQTFILQKVTTGIQNNVLMIGFIHLGLPESTLCLWRALGPCSWRRIISR